MTSVSLNIYQAKNVKYSLTWIFYVLWYQVSYVDFHNVPCIHFAVWLHKCWRLAVTHLFYVEDRISQGQYTFTRVHLFMYVCMHTFRHYIKIVLMQCHRMNHDWNINRTLCSRCLKWKKQIQFSNCFKSTFY